MSYYSEEIAGSADAVDLARLFEMTPMEGAIRVVMERPRDFFHAVGVQCTDPKVLIARSDLTGKPVAVCGAGERRVFVNGEARPVIYLSDLRLDPSVRSGRLLFRGFRFVREYVMNGDDFAQTIVLKGNAPALDLLTSGRAGLPHYYEMGAYDCLAVRLGRSHREVRSGYDVRRATAADIPLMQSLFDLEAPRKQFYPAYDFFQLGEPYYRGLKIEDHWLAWKGSELVGFAAAWDQLAYKQTRVVGYGGLLGAIRPLINIAADMTGGFRLPPPQTAPPHFHVSCVICRENDPEVFAELIRHIYNRHLGSPYEYFLCGFDRNDPLRHALAPYKKMNYPGRHFLVSYGKDPRPGLAPGPFYFEAARI